MQPTISYQQAYDQLGGVYDPQVNSVNSQIAGLQPQQDAQQAGLDQAKVNAFRDITNSSNARGVLFSGVPIDQQATYVGTKYLPAVVNLKQTFANQRTTLLDKINAINAQRSQQASSTVSAAQQAAATAAYHNAQLQLGYARLAQSGANAAGRQPSQSQIMQQDMAGAAQHLASRAGKDGHVNPVDWRNAYTAWTGAGYKGSDFVKQFQNYINPHSNHYVGFD